MRTVKSISNPRPTPPPPGPELVVTPRPAEAARLNVDSRTLAQVLRIATIGDIDANVAKYSEGERSEEHTSELQSIMRISYAVSCLKKQEKDIHEVHITISISQA